MLGVEVEMQVAHICLEENSRPQSKVHSITIMTFGNWIPGLVSGVELREKESHQAHRREVDIA